MPQVRVVLRNCDVIDPRRISTYLERDGFKALEKTRRGMTPENGKEPVKRRGVKNTLSAMPMKGK